MPKCDECKWWMGETQCLLGRDSERCTGVGARRGDDDLVARIMKLPRGDLSKVRDRLDGKDGDVTVHDKELDDWK